MKGYLVLAGFLLVTVGGGLAIGFVTRPGAWYARRFRAPTFLLFAS